jgi:succinate dehydrogenase/fumarate reductase flavoprotein subunit
MVCPQYSDSSVHFNDSMRGSYGLADAELVRIFTEEAPQAVFA